jgi:hypothetical protein
MSLFTLPKQVVVQSDGTPYASAKAYFYQAGTTTDQSVYTTSALSVAHAQPVQADASGVFPAIYFNPGASADYRVQIKTSAGVLIYDEDNIPRDEAEVQGTFTATLTGVSGTVTGTAYYSRHGKAVTLFLPLLSGTSNAATCTITGLPAALIPARTQGNYVMGILDNSSPAFGYIQAESGGVIRCYKSAGATGSDWTASGTKSIAATNMTYLLS